MKEYFPPGWFDQKIPSCPIQMRILDTLTEIYSGDAIGRWFYGARNKTHFLAGKYRLNLKMSAQ